MNKENREIEARFLEIDVEAFKKRLTEVSAEDLGEDFLQEVIFYDKDLEWQKYGRKFARLRQNKKGVFMTFKHVETDTVEGAQEIELKVDNFDKAKDFLEEVGLVAFREQEKKRHSFKLGNVIVDIDTWPSIPTYLELEGPSEEDLKKAAQILGLDWSQAVFEDARHIIENRYKVPVGQYKYFTFEKVG